MDALDDLAKRGKLAKAQSVRDPSVTDKYRDTLLKRDRRIIMYEYLKKYYRNKEDEITDISCNNIFYPLDEKIIIEAEQLLGFNFPISLRKFYEEVGYGHITTPVKKDSNYEFYASNEILHPIVVSRFFHGELLNDDYHAYMTDYAYEELPKGDIPVFEIGDGSSFMTMKPESDHPNAVWYLGYEKIEDSFETFIYNLYYDDPVYYTRRWK
ncbi:MAG TPA: hypothetical protein DIC42_02550 [Holosporales bacterium]|nr:hypothetical protein [Holosporales bacterium]